MIKLLRVYNKPPSGNTDRTICLNSSPTGDTVEFDYGGNSLI